VGKYDKSGKLLLYTVKYCKEIPSAPSYLDIIPQRRGGEGKRGGRVNSVITAHIARDERLQGELCRETRPNLAA